jgi:hypothetical protein
VIFYQNFPERGLNVPVGLNSPVAKYLLRFELSRKMENFINSSQNEGR